MGVALGWVGEKPRGQVNTSMGVGVPWEERGGGGRWRGEKSRSHADKRWVGGRGGGGGLLGHINRRKTERTDRK